MLDFIRSMAPGGVLAKLCGAPAPEGPPDPAPAAASAGLLAERTIAAETELEAISDVVTGGRPVEDFIPAEGVLGEVIARIGQLERYLRDEPRGDSLLRLEKQLTEARAASAGEGALRERIERIAENFANNAEHAEWRVKEYARDCPLDAARHVAEGRARTWRFCAAILNEELRAAPAQREGKP